MTPMTSNDAARQTSPPVPSGAGTRSASPSGSAGASRLGYMDQIRAVLTILVVAHHAAQPYGPTGGSWPITYPQHERMLGPFFHTNASYFMGFFFLLAAYFVPPAFDKKGSRRFLLDRLLRLGLPTLGVAFLLLPGFAYFFMAPAGTDLWSFFWNKWVLGGQLTFAHMWFCVHLLIYACLFALWRKWIPSTKPPEMRPFPSNWALLAYAVALGVVSGIVRIWYPIDRWTPFPLPAELGHFPQYFSLTLFGYIAWRHRWLERIPESTGRLWLGIGVLATIWRYTFTATHGRMFAEGSVFRPFADEIFLLWESLICVGMCIGLLYAFQKWLNRMTPAWQFLSRNAYGVYVLHLPILIAFHFMVQKSGQGPVTLTVVTTLATCVVCYLLTELVLRRVPGLRSIF